MNGWLYCIFQANKYLSQIIEGLRAATILHELKSIPPEQVVAWVTLNYTSCLCMSVHDVPKDGMEKFLQTLV